MPTKEETNAIRHLKLNINSKPDEISSALRKAMRANHPDMQNGKDAETKEKAAKEFLTLHELQDAIKHQNERQKLDATNTNEARLHETHKEFSLDKLARELNKMSDGKGTLEVLDEPASKPDQTVSNPKTAIVTLDYHKQLANLSGKFKYTRQFGNRPPVSVELDMTGSRPVIRSEITEDGIRASAETILAMGHKHVNILQPDEYTDEQRDLIERTFTKAGVTPLFGEPSAKKSVAIGDQPKAEEQLAITDRHGKLASERAATIDPAREELAL